MLLNFCAALLSWIFTPHLTPSKSPPSSAFQWWQQRQSDRLHQTAEHIREGLLQDLFAVRRTLELADMEDQPIAQRSLQQLDALHLQLEAIMHVLSPTFGHDHLPLAIQYLLEQWHTQYPGVSLALQLPPSPASLQSPPTMNAVVLSTLEALLDLVGQLLGESLGQPPRGPTSNGERTTIQVELTDISSTGRSSTTQLTVQVQGLNQTQRDAIAHSPDLPYLRESFQCLTNGHVVEMIIENSTEASTEASTEITTETGGDVGNDAGIQWQFQWS